MKRLVFLVEGDTELKFIEQRVKSYLYSKCGYGIAINAQKITTNKTLNAKGGNVSFEYLKNELKRLSAKDDVLITTLLDFFRLPTNFPNHSTDKKDIEKIEKGILEQVEDIVSFKRFLPYIQLHEVEALLFANGLDGFDIVVDKDTQKSKLRDIIDQYPCPEAINGGSDTAPSKRLESIFPKYNKVYYSELIFSGLEIDAIRAKCPRFNTWLDKVECGIRHSLFPC